MIPGTSIILILSLSALSLLYYFGFALFNDIRLREIFKKTSYDKTTPKKIIGAVAFGFALAAIAMGVLFKVELWPGGDNQLKIGLITMVVLIIIALIFNKGQKSTYFRRLYFRGIIFGVFGLIMLIIPHTTLIDIYFHDKPEYSKLLKEYYNNSEYDEDLQKKLDEAYEKEFK